MRVKDTVWVLPPSRGAPHGVFLFSEADGAGIPRPGSGGNRFVPGDLIWGGAGMKKQWHFDYWEEPQEPEPQV